MRWRCSSAGPATCQLADEPESWPGCAWPDLRQATLRVPRPGDPPSKPGYRTTLAPTSPSGEQRFLRFARVGAGQARPTQCGLLYRLAAHRVDGGQRAGHWRVLIAPESSHGHTNLPGDSEPDALPAHMRAARCGTRQTRSTEAMPLTDVQGEAWHMARSAGRSRRKSSRRARVS